MIGDFGLVGGGAAGLELDRYDLEFGTPHNAYLLARSENHTNLMMQVNEEIHFNNPILSSLYCGKIFIVTGSLSNLYTPYFLGGPLV